MPRRTDCTASRKSIPPPPPPVARTSGLIIATCSINLWPRQSPASQTQWWLGGLFSLSPEARSLLVSILPPRPLLVPCQVGLSSITSPWLCRDAFNSIRPCAVCLCVQLRAGLGLVTIRAVLCCTFAAKKDTKCSSSRSLRFMSCCLSSFFPGRRHAPL